MFFENDFKFFVQCFVVFLMKTNIYFMFTPSKITVYMYPFEHFNIVSISKSQKVSTMSQKSYSPILSNRKTAMGYLSKKY